ncbi:hypothetical protein DACRYDRAFT_22425, partial [Dacryopinax primogenitus]
QERAELRLFPGAVSDSGPTAYIKLKDARDLLNSRWFIGTRGFTEDNIVVDGPGKQGTI